MKQLSYLSSDPSIMRGALVIKGTRVPMERILYMVSEGFTVDEIHDHYSWVSKKALQGAIAELATKIDTVDYDSKILQAQNPLG